MSRQLFAWLYILNCLHFQLLRYGFNYTFTVVEGRIDILDVFVLLLAFGGNNQRPAFFTKNFNKFTKKYTINVFSFRYGNHRFAKEF